MADSTTSRGGSDRLRINMHQGWEVDYWTRKLGVSREELAKAIEIAGDRAHDVADYLADEGRPATTE
jgi:hypothetical protein